MLRLGNLSLGCALGKAQGTLKVGHAFGSAKKKTVRETNLLEMSPGSAGKAILEL